MMSILRNILLILVLALSLSASGQSISTDFDRKIINTDSLNLPNNTSASALITLLPELLQRPGNYILSNYDVQVEGMSVGSTADVALNGLHIIDIQRIEVSESPLSSYQKNGQGGSINIVLRTKGRENADKWGSVALDATSPLNFSPQFNIGYKKDRFMIRGIALSELENGSSDTQTLLYNNDKYLSQTFANQITRFRSELTRAYMQYDITPKDILRFNLSEIYTYNRTKNLTDYDEERSVFQRQHSLNLQALLRYQHTTPRNTFTAQMEYRYLPQSNFYDVSSLYKYDSDTKTNNISGKVEYKTLLFSQSSLQSAKRRGDISVGVNFNASYSHENNVIDDKRASGGGIAGVIPKNNAYYFMPYASFTTSLGKFRLKASGEFQHYNYSYERTNHQYSSISNDFTGKLMAEWHFTESKNLRFILDRKLQRPDSEQLFPYRLFSPKRFEYVEGNPDLKPMMVHEVTLDYIGTYKWGDFHKLVFNAGTSFSTITDIIGSLRSQQSGTNGESIGYIQQYLTFENRGSSKISSANLMALYSYKRFSLSLTGNLYHKMLDADSGDNHYTYYNISVHPHFSLNDGWHGGARFVYYSRVDQHDSYLGDCALTDITVGKAFKHLFIYVSECVSVIKDCKDVTLSGNSRTEKKYQLVPNYVSVGMKYTF